MTLVSTGSRQQFVAQLAAEVARRLRPEKARQVAEFALQFYENLPVEELSGRQLGDVYGCTFGWWNFAQKRDPSRPKIAVHNPTLEEDGWLSNHTIIAILQRDMPFLVDSVRLELHRRNITVHTLHSNVLSLTRDDEDQLQELLSRGAEAATRDGRPIRREAAIHMEVTRHSARKDRDELLEAISSVLSDVALVTDDFQPMANRTRLILEELEKRPPISTPEAEISEARHFLRWMLDNHFTFLGFVELDFIDDREAALLRERPDSHLGLLRKHPQRNQRLLVSELDPRAARLLLEPRLLRFSKSSFRSRVHRSAYSEYVTIKRFDEHGEVAGEYRFLGLYASRAYTARPSSIPLIRDKVAYVMQHSSVGPDGQDAKDLQHVLETFPRDELFHSEAGELLDTALGIARIRQRRKVRLFVRHDPLGRFISCLVFMPRDIYHTGIRSRVQELLSEAFEAREAEWATHMSESVLTRTHFVFRIDPGKPLDYDLESLEQQIVAVTRTWEEQFGDAMSDAFGEERGALYARLYGVAFPPSYKHDFEPRAAVNDIRAIERLRTTSDIAMSFFRPVGEPENGVRFKLFHLEEMLALSDMLPILENLGLRVVGDHPYALSRRDGKEIWIHDFRLVYKLADSIDIPQVKDNFKKTFASIWSGRAESDTFNRLILGTQLSWREVAILRAYARYMKQIAFRFSQEYIADTLARHLTLAQKIVALFHTRFDPQVNADPDAARHQLRELESDILAALDGVESLDEDRIIRRYLDLIRGTLRTNYYQRDASGSPKDYLSFKLEPQSIPEMPVPRPLYEIFVYSPRVEGVHLRSGKVARGGLRWSDRREDYRTEILGLLKAQQVKNAVIVPVGAKGGFVAKQLPADSTREQIQEEGIACYRTFIRGLLDLTDNLRDGLPIPPPKVVRNDEDDTYLVVAADKGTATFSDIANEVSASYGHWLGDAFASGGSVGYDHKKMGITARGAWVSVQRHFRERGIDVQKQAFSVIGIGDMSGDVFGNGMLLSEHIELVAAFNHLEIFIDPDPDPKSSFAERRRLFELPRSTWSDYRAELISKGGGVYPRSAKAIALSREARERLGIGAENLTPSELITALLKARVDLIWNGGIGTYAKASCESHADVGDKGNDVLRIDARDFQCRVVAEGGNLGLTQLARVEYCLGGGASNTDSIDNVGGVDCSDHEVNIKILLNEIAANGDMTEKQRRELLKEMTDSVGELVVHDSYRQVQAISIAEAQAEARFGEYRRFIATLEGLGKLDRGLEAIPDDDSLIERNAQGKGLTRPELGVLLSYSKAILKEELVESDVPHDPYCSRAVETAFPDRLRREFRDQIHRHRLRREIVATQIANDLVNHMGFTFVHRMMRSTGANPGQVARAYVTTRDVFAVDTHWSEIEALDATLPCELQVQLMLGLMRLVRRGSRWFLRNRRRTFDVADEVQRFAPAVQEVSSIFPELLRGELTNDWQRENQRLLESGVPRDLARFIAASSNLHSCLAIAEATQTTGESLRRVAQLFFALGEELKLHWFGRRVSDLAVENHWQALARESALDDLDWQQRALTVAVLEFMEEGEEIERGIHRWMARYQPLLDRWQAMLTELHGGVSSDFAMYAVGVRELLNLAQSSSHRAYDGKPRADS
jgi:glutamate dehydrogenase